MECGLALGRICPACEHVNLPGSEHCLNCGTPLDTIASVTSRVGAGKRRSDALRGERLVRQKGEDMAYMKRERERIDGQERERQQDFARQRLEARRQQRTLFIVVGLVFLLVMIGAAAVTFYMSTIR